MTFTISETHASEPIAQPDREAAILLCAFPGLMREPMAEDLWALADFLEDDRV